MVVVFQIRYYDAVLLLQEYIFNARARDYAKIGRLYLNKGKWNDKQIVSENWVAQSTKIDTTNNSFRFLCVSANSLSLSRSFKKKFDNWTMLCCIESFMILKINFILLAPYLAP
jgi:CubicO group peptidase (beta-lactamase class C family)